VYREAIPQKQGDAQAWVGPANPDPIIVRGQEAWARLRQELAWEDWLAVGEALRLGRHLAMLEARTNKPSGKRYQGIYGDWLRQNGFDEIDKGDRSRLFDCLDHRTEIDAWRQTLPLNQRVRLNHPNSIWRNWQKSTIAGRTTVAPRASPTATYKDEIVRLEDENSRLRRAGDDLFTTTDAAIDIARVLADRLARLTPAKAKQVLERLPDLYAQRSAEAPYENARPRARKKKGRRTIEDFRRDLAARKAGAEAQR
jgi:hypothetical protein